MKAIAQKAICFIETKPHIFSLTVLCSNEKYLPIYFLQFKNVTFSSSE